MRTLEGWQTGHLGELCSIEIGGTPSRSNPDFWDTSKESSNLWVSIKDLNKTVITETAEYLSDSGTKHSNAKLQKQGTVLLSFKLSIGRVAFAGVPLYTNEAIAGLNSNKINPYYLFHGLHQWDLLKNVDQAIKGATLNKEKLKKITFDYPESGTEQTKIAEILSTVDRAIEQTEALIAKQQRIKTGLMQDLLTRGIDEHGNLRSEQTHPFKDSPLGRIPVEWEVLSLQKTCSVFDSLHRTPIFSDDGYAMVRVTDVKAGNLSLNSCVRVTKSVFHEFTINYIPRAGDIVMSRVGTYGISSFVRTNEPFCLGQNTVIITGHNNSQFLFEFLQTPIVRTFFDLQLAGSSQKTLSLKAIRETPVPVVSMEEMSQVVCALEAMNNLNHESISIFSNLRSLKTALMQDLLTGKVRVTPLLNNTETCV